jgi:hypothetical protein
MRTCLDCPNQFECPFFANTDDGICIFKKRIRKSTSLVTSTGPFIIPEEHATWIERLNEFHIMLSLEQVSVYQLQMQEIHQNSSIFFQQQHLPLYVKTQQMQDPVQGFFERHRN